MKCGNCEHWKWNLQEETIADLLKQFNLMGKAIGVCTKDGNNYPMFSYENCGLCKEEPPVSGNKSDAYMNNLYNAMLVNFRNGCELYYGKEGAMRLAREFGCGLNDFPIRDAYDTLQSSYTAMFVKLYVFGPFTETVKDTEVDAKDWVSGNQVQHDLL